MRALIKYRNQAYNFFSQWMVTRRYVHKLEREFDILRPGDASGKRQQILKIMGISSLAMLVVIGWMLYQGVDFYNFLITVTLLYVVYHQVIHIHLQREEYKLLRNLEKFLGNMRHEYYVTQMVDEAVYEAAEKSKGSMQLHGELIYELLSDPDMENALERYGESAPNGYFRTLLAICMSAIQFGDKIVNKQSLFLMNLSNLRQEVNMELLKRSKMKYAFSGLVFLCIAPMLTLNIIKDWGISNLPELVDFYYGTKGVLCSVLIIVCSIIAYHIVMVLKEDIHIRKEQHPMLEWLLECHIINRAIWKWLNRNYGKTMRRKEMLKRAGDSLSVAEMQVKQSLVGVSLFVIGVALSIAVHSTNRQRLLQDISNVESLVVDADKEELNHMKELLPELTKQYKNQVTKLETIIQCLKGRWPDGEARLIEALGSEVQRRIEAVSREHIQWYEAVFWVLAAILGYFFPLWFLLYRTRVRQMNMEDEVVQYQSVIMMLIYFEQVTVEMLLRWMEHFADVFHASIEECINNYPWNDKKALETLKEEEPFEPFARIVENLQMCEQIGIRKAFEEVAMDRNHFQEKRKQEREIQINKKAIYGKVAAYAPMMATVGLYLIVPFVVESLSQLLEYSVQMQAL